MNTVQPIFPAFSNTPRFEGVTRKARKQFRDEHELRRLIQRAKHPYMGGLPKPLRECGVSPKEVYQTLDQVKRALSLWVNPMKNERRYHFSRELGEQRLRADYVDEGVYGMVYRLQVGEAQYALKIYFNLDQVFRDLAEQYHVSISSAVTNGHGPYAEAASGVFFSNWKIQNASRMLCANPTEGWSLEEWIEPDAKPEQRPGKRLEKILERFRLTPGEIALESNSNRHSIVWDRGGIRKKTADPPPSSPKSGSGSDEDGSEWFI